MSIETYVRNKYAAFGCETAKVSLPIEYLSDELLVGRYEAIELADQVLGRKTSKNTTLTLDEFIAIVEAGLQ